MTTPTRMAWTEPRTPQPYARPSFLRGMGSVAQRGQVFGFVIAMTALVGGIVLLFFERSLEGYTTIGTGMASLVVAFTIGRVAKRGQPSPMNDPEREA